jgi:hypothetical protein
MELKLSVSIGATLQVKNSRGEWDWIKPEVGAEVLLSQHDLKKGNDEDNSLLQGVFAQIWDDVVGPQFASVVKELIGEQVDKEEVPKEETAEDFRETLTNVAEGAPEDKKPNVDEDDYY